MRPTTTITLALCGWLGAASLASAQQSVGAPAGRDPATAPGGTEGIAGPRNEREAIRSGDAVPVAPGRSGIPNAVEAVPPPGTASPALAPPPAGR